jgi:hypothetical protein
MTPNPAIFRPLDNLGEVLYLGRRGGRRDHICLRPD